MTTDNTLRKKGFRCLFALVTVTTLAVPYIALGAGAGFRNSGTFRSSSHGQQAFSQRDGRVAGPAFRNSGTFRSNSHGQHSFPHPFHRFGFFRGDGFDDFGGDGLDVSIQPVQPAPSSEPEPVENRIYVPPRWVDGGSGVQISQPGYWAVPK
jgi:hypothetical protein